MEDSGASAAAGAAQELARSTSTHQHASQDPQTGGSTIYKGSGSEVGERAPGAVQMDVDEHVAQQDGAKIALESSKGYLEPVETEPARTELASSNVPHPGPSTPYASSSAHLAPLVPHHSSTSPLDLENLPRSETNTAADQATPRPRMTWAERFEAPNASKKHAETEQKSGDVQARNGKDLLKTVQDSPPSAEASPAAASQPILPRASSSLPTLDSSWPSKEAFFAGCRRGLKESCGVGSWQHTSEMNYARVVCAKRFSKTCGYAVVVRREEDGRWVVKKDTTVLVHSHGPEPVGEEEEREEDGDDREGSNAEPQAGQRGITTLVIKDSDDEDEPVEIASFNATANIADWTLTTRCKTIRQLVSERDTVFKRQRTFAIDHLQEQSRQLALQYFNSFQPSKFHPSPCGNVCRIYYQFCADLHLPPFPITPSIIALCVWWLTVKAPAIDFYPFVVFLNGVKKATQTLWEERLAEKESNGSLMRFTALEEFLLERGAKEINTVTRSVPSAASQPSATRPRAIPAVSIKKVSSSAPPPKAAPKKALVIPNAPQVGDRFADPDAAVEHVRVHVVPVLGVGVGTSQSSSVNTVKLRCYHGKNVNKRCEYQIVLVKDDSRTDWVVHKSSTLRHDHGPRPQILADPNWRPPQFGGRRSSGGRGRSGQASSTSTFASDCEDDEDDDSDGEDDGSEEDAPRRRRPSPRATAKRTSAAPVTATFPKKLKVSSMGESTSPFAAPTQSRYSQPAFNARNSASHALPSPAPSSSRDPTPSLYAIGRPPISTTSSTLAFIPTITTFLTSLHPSLGALGSILYQAGLQDTALLVRFLGMEEDLRDRFLADEVKAGLLQKHLFKKELKAAKESAWAVGSAREG